MLRLVRVAITRLVVPLPTIRSLIEIVAELAAFVTFTRMLSLESGYAVAPSEKVGEFLVRRAYCGLF